MGEADGTIVLNYNYKYDNSGSAKASYTYNANNLRADKTVNRQKTTFAWNGQNLAAETTTDTTNTYTYDITGVHIANQNGNITAYLKDYHGNVVGTTTKAGVMVQEANNRMDYDAFGNQWRGDTPDPFGYCGEYYDTESGLIYLRNRYYDTTTGRFITEDPAKDGNNWYSYCKNNPVMMVDPSGLYVVGIRLWNDALILGNVERKETGIYCNLRNIVTSSEHLGVAIRWNSYENNGLAILNFNKNDNRYEIQIEFDSLEPNTYASRVSVYKNNELADSEDPVKSFLDSEEAYFYLKKGDIGDDSIRIQAKMSTMFWLFENNSMYQLFMMAYETAENMSEKYGYDMQKILDVFTNDPMLKIDLSGKAPNETDILSKLL